MWLFGVTLALVSEGVKAHLMAVEHLVNTASSKLRCGENMEVKQIQARWSLLAVRNDPRFFTEHLLLPPAHKKTRKKFSKGWLVVRQSVTQRRSSMHW